MFTSSAPRPKAPTGASAVFRGMYLGGDESLVSREWMETHIRQDHGPLGAPLSAENLHLPRPHGAIKEGDSPSWLYFLDNGMNDAAHPEYGGWGGRFELDEKASAGRVVFIATRRTRSATKPAPAPRLALAPGDRRRLCDAAGLVRR